MEDFDGTPSSDWEQYEYPAIAASQLQTEGQET
jgi:hypothetical protein